MGGSLSLWSRARTKACGAEREERQNKENDVPNPCSQRLYASSILLR
jgi:hypothetical protein